MFLLAFFALWTFLYSCILYASRFNDRDTWHSILWSTVLMGLLFAAGCEGETGFGANLGYGWGICALHLLISFANARVALFVPRARVYGAWMSFQSLCAASLFAVLPWYESGSTMYRVLLWINVF